MSTTEQRAQSAAERRSAEAEVTRLIGKFAPAHERVIASVRRSLHKRLPTAHEVVYEYRDCFVISYSPSERGYEGVLSLRGSEDGVKLYFTRGKELPDPEKLLRGSANVRWILLDSSSAIARPEVARLIDVAMARHRVPFAATGRGPVVIRSKSAKPR
jgi:hypothetical protein